MSNIESATLVNSDYLTSAIFFKRVGKVVYLSYVSDVKQLPIGYTKIGDVPTNMVPVAEYLVMNCFSGKIQISINASGEIGFHNYSGEAISQVYTCRFCGSYIAAN